MKKMSQPGSLFLVLAFILGALVPLEYAEGKQTAYACEGNVLRLECDPGKVIHLIRAIYGRFSITICNENGNTEWSVNCGSPKSILVLNGTCNYQRSCSVVASTKTFGDPCPGTVKYLEVQYQCIPASSLTSTTTTPKSLASGGPPLLPWNNLPLPFPPQNNNQSSSSSAASSSSTELEPYNPPGLNFPTTFSSGSSSTALIPLVVTTPTSSPTTTTTTTTSTTSPATFPSDLSSQNHSEADEDDQEEGNEETESDEEGKWAAPPAAGENWWQFQGETENEKVSLGVPKGVVTQTPILEIIQPEDGDDQKGRHRSSLLHCPSRLDRGIFWNFTVAGETAKQPCPGGASGLARWRCLEDGNWFPESPDLSDCKSAWLLSLQARVLEGDRISNVAGDLAQVTSTKQMYGGDIAAAVRIIKTIATRMNDQLRSLSNQVSREDLAGELLQLILEAGSNLLEKARLDPWRDLSFTDQMKIATDLLVGLEDNAFLLANVVNSEKTVRKSVKNILTNIYAIEANNVREINFPSDGGDHWSRMGDVLTMPAEALRENSDGGLVRLVCFAYNNLEHVLQPHHISSSSNEISTSRKLVNSRVISASLNQGRHIQLALPVRLTLRHLWLDNVSNPQCVFWDYTQDKWSEEGCRVVETNRTHTICQCTHLTNFAILMDLNPPLKELPTPEILQVVNYIGSAVLILCLLFTLVITHFCIHGKVFQTMILKNLFFCILVSELIFVFGIHQVGKPFGCTSIAMMLHYFALASILWLFLHGFHLHLIVVEAAEPGLSRQLWYYGVSYGSPFIVVLLSFLLDPRSYRSDRICWIQTSFALLCFVGPAVLVAIASFVVLFFTCHKVCGLLSSMPKKPNDDKSLYVYAGTWLRGTFLILILMSFSWTLRLLELESPSSPALSYAASLALAIEGIAILIFHALKSEDTITKICDCAKSSDSTDTEMSTHSQQPQPIQQNGGGGYMEPERIVDSHGRMFESLSRPRHRNEGIYTKHGGPEFLVGHPELGLYSKQSDASWGGYHRGDPVYEEIERPRGGADLSDDEQLAYPYHHPHLDIYHHGSSIYGSQVCAQPSRAHHSHSHQYHPVQNLTLSSLRKMEGEVTNPLLASINRSAHGPHANSPHYSTRVEHVLQNVHMV